MAALAGVSLAQTIVELRKVARETRRLRDPEPVETT
jgi:hypothetical protein